MIWLSIRSWDTVNCDCLHLAASYGVVGIGWKLSGYLSIEYVTCKFIADSNALWSGAGLLFLTQKAAI
jgi:hypothetical protein